MVEDSLVKWREKLLDVGKGNPLLNFNESKLRSVKILSPSLDRLFDSIMNDVSFRFFDTDAYIEKYIDDERRKLLTAEENEDFNPTFSESRIISMFGDKVGSKEILAYKSSSLKKTLKNLKKIAESSLNEKGINVLYLAFGFLRWKERDSQDIVFKAPLLLVPVSIDNESKKQPFYLNLYEDEVSTNPSLVYKFGNDFKIEIPIFRSSDPNESPNEYFDKLDKMLSEFGFSVERNVEIGLFSFLKMAMYQDYVDNEKDIIAHPAVRRIAGDDRGFVKDSIIDYDGFFDKGREIELHNVVDADSSQISAIVAAKAGHNLVLQGPPGTGKSQTITNLIAEFLYDGKKVLFVSEKLAALEVVYNNLKKAQLSDFCLQLHGSKLNKKEFVEEIYGTFAAQRKSVKPEASSEIDELKRNKAKLDTYAKVMHTPIELLNKTPYELLGLTLEYQTYPSFDYAIPSLTTKDSKFLDQSVATIQNFTNVSSYFSYDFRTEAWFGSNVISLSYEENTSLKESLIKITSFIDEINNRTELLHQKYGIYVKTLDDIDDLVPCLEAIISLKCYTGQIFNKYRRNDLIELLNDFINENEKYNSSLTLIQNTFTDDIYSGDTKRELDILVNSRSIFSHLFNKDYKVVLNRLKECLKNTDSKLNRSTAINYLRALDRVEKGKGVIKEKRNEIRDQYGISISEKDATDVLNSILNLDKELENKEKYFDFNVYADLTFEEFSSIQKAINDFTTWFKENSSSRVSLSLIQYYFDRNIVNFDTMSITDLSKKLNRLLTNFDSLQAWQKLAASINELKDKGLYDFVIKSIDNNIPRETLAGTYTRLYYEQWQWSIFQTTPILREFNRQSQDEAARLFREKDKISLDIMKAEINAKLTKNYPSFDTITYPGSEAYILNREHNKKKRIMPVRFLLKDCGHLIQQIKPCFLMSPLSVSTYLDHDSCHFDVVIFDEASQIFPWDAIGAIYRGKQVIVVGDSKQMPPSNYFMAELEEEVDDDTFMDSSLDFESILDMCAATFDQRSLTWHYRSRTEDLISFSNANFYDNNLVSFPYASHGHKDFGVEFYYVGRGIFDRKTKKNKKEAEAVASLVYDHYKNHPNRSIGVVAFSINQQDAIEDAINELRDQDPKFDEYFNEPRPEPFFIKNLETVQGDERDTIIFSIAYAYDKDGKFYLNFGPLNREGGERRLNVAVTRAKLNVKVVSSIKGNDIDTSRSSSLGVALLKAYLDYAEKGNPIQREDVREDMDERHYLEKDICSVLKEKGYSYDTNVGCSSYRIDIAIKHPKTGDYVLAIETDGDTYFSGKTTRDRDRLRQEVLEKQKWTFYRVWSCEWINNRKLEIDRLISAIETAIKNYTEDTFDELESNVKMIDNKLSDLQDQLNNAEIIDSGFMTYSDVQNSSDFSSIFPTYKEFDTEAYVRKNSGHAFMFNLYDYYRNGIEGIVSVEKPITKNLLLKRFAVLCGRREVTSYVRDQFERYKKYTTIHFIDDYYYINSSPYKEMPFRIPPKEYTFKRDISDIPLIEIMTGMKEIIKRATGIDKDGLYSVLTHAAGYKQVGQKIRTRLDKALNILKVNGEIVINEQGKIFLNI